MERVPQVVYHTHSNGEGAGDENKVPIINYISASPVKINPNVAKMYGVEITMREDTVTYRIGSSVPPTEE